MANDKSKKQPTAKKPKGLKNKSASAGTAKSEPRAARKAMDKTLRSATAKAKELASNPAVAEIVAASLVAAAAAIKNPKKARDLAASVGNELETASKQAVDKGNAFWKLALDVARRSIDALSVEKGPRKSKGSKKKSRK